jgi:hypothetical protein
MWISDEGVMARQCELVLMHNLLCYSLQGMLALFHVLARS